MPVQSSARGESGRPRITVITPSFNQDKFIEDTILSVLNQGYERLEYIVIDGGSSDKSVEIIRRYDHRLTYWVSEQDRGQAHAINKGVERATGDITAFLNSDDVYLPGALNGVADHFDRHPDCDWVCGDTIMFGGGHQTKLIRSVVPKSAAHCLAWAYAAHQPGHFWKTDLVRQGFDERWIYAFDRDMYVRLLLAGHACQHLSLPLAGYRLHPASRTIGEANRFHDEFDAMAERYEPHLRGAGRRWCRATRWARRSCAASAAGRRGEGARWLFRALTTYPEGLKNRLFWGSLRRLLSSSFRRAGHHTAGR